MYTCNYHNLPLPISRSVNSMSCREASCYFLHGHHATVILVHCPDAAKSAVRSRVLGTYAVEYSSSLHFLHQLLNCTAEIWEILVPGWFCCIRSRTAWITNVFLFLFFTKLNGKPSDFCQNILSPACSIYSFTFGFAEERGKRSGRVPWFRGFSVAGGEVAAVMLHTSLPLPSRLVVSFSKKRKKWTCSGRKFCFLNLELKGCHQSHCPYFTCESSNSCLWRLSCLFWLSVKESQSYWFYLPLKRSPVVLVYFCPLINIVAQ